MSDRPIANIAQKEAGLKKELTTAQLGMIAIGGAIGTGLFLGSGFAISLAGPAVIISYVIGGLIALVMMACLSEMTVSQPTAGSFGVYAEQYINPYMGFTLRYSYWIGIVIGIGAELTAIGIYMVRWFPDIPPIVWIFLFSAILIYVNCTSVGNFGAFEFVFASIKVIAIVAFIIVGCIVVFGGDNPNITFDNYSNDDGFAPYGVSGILLGAFIAVFSYLSMEMIAVTAGEAKDPEKAVPKALRSAMVRLFLFYILALGIMLAMIPWKQAGAGGLEGSPFVLAFSMVGIPYADHIMNFVVLTAALSAINSMLYITSRMMFSLSRGGYAPKKFGELSKKGVPIYALGISCIGIFLAAVVSQVMPQDSHFVSLMGMSMFGPLFTWTTIMVTHLFFRKKWEAMGGRKLPVRVPFYPYTTWFGILLMLTVVIYSCVTVFKMTLFMGSCWFIFISVVYCVWYRKPRNTEGEHDNN